MREPHFGWCAVAFGLFALRILAIIDFLTTMRREWPFWHQVVAGWTALALLWAVIVFAHRSRWRSWYWLLLAFPPLWSYVAVIRLDTFTLAAVPAVLFISGASLWAGVVLLRARTSGTAGTSKFLGWTFLVWACITSTTRSCARWLPGCRGRSFAGQLYRYWHTGRLRRIRNSRHTAGMLPRGAARTLAPSGSV